MPTTTIVGVTPTVSLVGLTPTLTDRFASSPASLTITGSTPGLTVTVAPESASMFLDVLEIMPMALDGIDVGPGGAALTITADTPSLGTTVTPGMASVAASTVNPPVSNRRLVDPTGTDLTLTGNPIILRTTDTAAGGQFVGTSHTDFVAWARELRDYRIRRAYDRPQIKLYDGDWNYRGTVYGEISGHVNPLVNQTGTIELRLPIDLDDKRRTWAAFWALDEDARGTRNVHIVVETMGARIGGRMKPKNGATVVRGEKGDEVVLSFYDDIEELKFVHTAGNPFLPISLIQQPKAWMLLAPADHGLLITLAANLLRLQLTNINLPSDLLDPTTWPSNPLDLWAQSQIVVMPRKIGDSVAPLSLVVGSIRTSWMDVAAPILEDSELQLWTRRWLTGDPEPYPGGGTNWRNGTLFVDVVDRSGFRAGTSIGGNLLTGLTRTLANVLSNNVEDSYDLITGETIDETGYRLPGVLGTRAPHPYVVYRDGDITGIQTSEFARSPGGPGRITVGGQSMPGVNVCPPLGNRWGTDIIPNFANYSQRQSDMAATSSATTWTSPSQAPSVKPSPSDRLAVRWTHSSKASTPTQYSPTSPSRYCCVCSSSAGATTWKPPPPTSPRRSRPRASWTCGPAGAKPTPTSHSPFK